jgi:hypothetical protein
VFRRISWLPGGGGLTAPHTRSNRPLWTTSFRVVSAVVGALELRLLVVFVPRTSSTPVATWFWQTEGRHAKRVIQGVRPSEFILLECSSPSRRIFIGSHSLPPLWLPNRSFKWYQSRFGSLLTLTSLRSKDGVPGTSSGPPHFDGKNCQMWSMRMAAFLRGKGQILWDVTVDNRYV